MKSLLFALSFFALCSPSLLEAKAKAKHDPDQTPSSVVMLRGQAVPIFTEAHISPLRTIAPKYPPAQKVKGVQGETQIAVIIGVDGKVEEAQVKESKPDPEFGVASLKCVKGWRFPTMNYQGKPSRYIVVIPIIYSIADD